MRVFLDGNTVKRDYVLNSPVKFLRCLVVLNFQLATIISHLVQHS